MHRTARRTVGMLVGALGALVLAGSAPAVADTDRVTDARGDTATEDGRNPGQRTADILRFDSHHGEDRVAFRFLMADVDPRATLYATAVVRTSDGRRFQAQVGKLVDEPRRFLWISRGSGRSIRCPDADASVRPATRTVWISVPRSCLGEPRWVRTGGLVESRPPQGSVFTDDARRDGRVDEFDVALGSRRLARG